WPRMSKSVAGDAAPIVAGLRSATGRVHALADASVPHTPQLTEIARQELARISILGIAGFDTPLTRAPTREGADALAGLRAVFAADTAQWRAARAAYRATDSAFAATAAQLRSSDDFEQFDRLSFLAFHAIPAAHAVESLRRAAGATPVSIQRFW